MRKVIIDEPQTIESGSETFPPSLDLDTLAEVWLTSEAEGFPIESALQPPWMGEWRAAQPGEQVIRLMFDKPVDIKRILLEFQEQGVERTQEFVLRWSKNAEESQDICRQQYHFSPPGTTTEIEDYAVNLTQLKRLELVITPDISRGTTIATLKQLRVW